MNQAKPSADFQGASVLALGSFNPPIFHPLWFSRNNLIRDAEADAATIAIIVNDVAQFSAEWFNVLVTKDRFVIETKDPTKNLPLRDLAIGTFKVLEHTPIKAFAFSRFQHLPLGSETKWHEFGDFFAPKEGWAEIFPQAGLRTLIMQNHRGAKKEINYTLIRIEPSGLVEFGVFIQISQHYDPDPSSDDKVPNRLDEFLGELQSSWDSFLSSSDAYANRLLTVSTKAFPK